MANNMVLRHLAPEAQYAANTFSQDVSGSTLTGPNDGSGQFILPGSHLSGKTSATLSFIFTSTDTQGIIFAPNGTGGYICAFNSGDGTTALHSGVGSPTITIDGVAFSGTTRGDLYTALCDGSPHNVILNSINFTAVTPWATNGLYAGSYNVAWALDATLSEITLDGVIYGANRGIVRGGETMSSLYLGVGNGPGNILEDHGLLLDGTNDYITATIPVDGTGAKTFSCWFKTTSTATSDNCLFGLGNGGVAGQLWHMGIENGVVYLRTGSGAVASWGSGYNDDEWHHVILTVGASETLNDVLCYVDNEIVTRASIASPSTAINPLDSDGTIGDTPNGSYVFDGSIAAPTVYARKISRAEITSLYAEGAGINVPVKMTIYSRMRTSV